MAFSKEARDLLIECCVEFITLVSSEANDISEKEAKKTIACDHITKALETLGFSDYVPAVLEAASEHKEQQKVSIYPLPLAVPVEREFFFFLKKKSLIAHISICLFQHTHTHTGTRKETQQIRPERSLHGGTRAHAGRGL